MADEETSLALPYKTVANLNEVLFEIINEDIDLVVIGSPKKMSGEEANNKEWENFVSQLKEKSGVEVELLDERLSSLAADALDGEDKDKAGRDEIAATL
ncbi:MAG: Holliday junction resolvase RuvX, partial [Candidatus Falkowbacteria bacterium]|nr:Holliday junction resolvase RuvX [Candidatus Falkowbacteria bacterium]